MADTFKAIDYTVIGGQNVFLTSPKPENVSAGQIHLIGEGGTVRGRVVPRRVRRIVKPTTPTTSTPSLPGVAPIRS